jgi:DNA-binding MarR family transcriptional regulator
MSAPGSERTWTFLTNHAHVLVHVSRHPDARIRDIAAEVGITDRATQSILRDLEEGGYLTRVPRGRRNHYIVNERRPFRHPSEAQQRIGDLLALFG